MTTFSPERLDRFARHIVLPEVGGAGQFTLAEAHVALVGLGGIGSPALQYLAGAGIGRLTLIDDGKVELSNLQRQTIYAERDIGHGKAVSARRWLANFDSEIEVALNDRRIDRDNATEAIDGADLVLDGTDNFATRLAVSDACVASGIPLLSAAVGRFQGQVGAFAGHLGGEACYRCFVGDAFDADDCDTCADDGMLGAMAGWVGTFAALQAIRVLLQRTGGLGAPPWGKLYLLDGLAASMRAMTIAPDLECGRCGSPGG
ncbi:thiamine biosynthesis protein ThiF [Tsuneonella deserti]|uniref:Thiamine biosynthesis protein ThiF n=1 Tax=Tsuneonella deserti TaxID=2035528 RepID=A0ABQ1RYI2_9SPHN|nr:HesA/MoeB/ThiF family protein [Tsuneonella deserti]GGD87325.1 thiamine biosynthesis protein ThiF [Tsuneonella deserti]